MIYQHKWRASDPRRHPRISCKEYLRVVPALSASVGLVLVKIVLNSTQQGRQVKVELVNRLHCSNFLHIERGKTKPNKQWIPPKIPHTQRKPKRQTWGREEIQFLFISKEQERLTCLFHFCNFTFYICD
jgi:hypothetical protein